MARELPNYVQISVELPESPEIGCLHRVIGPHAYGFLLVLLRDVAVKGLTTGGRIETTFEAIQKAARLPDENTVRKGLDVMSRIKGLEKFSWRILDEEFGQIEISYPKVVEWHGRGRSTSENAQHAAKARWQKEHQCKHDASIMQASMRPMPKERKKERKKETDHTPPTPSLSPETQTPPDGVCDFSPTPEPDLDPDAVERIRESGKIHPGAKLDGVLLIADIERLCGKLSPADKLKARAELEIRRGEGHDIPLIQQTLATWREHYSVTSLPFVLSHLRGRLIGEPGPVWIAANRDKAKAEAASDAKLRSPATRNAEAQRRDAQRRAEEAEANTPEALEAAAKCLQTLQRLAADKRIPATESPNGAANGTVEDTS